MAMTDEEKNNMALSIENAVLKAFKEFDKCIDKKIQIHRETCRGTNGNKQTFGFGTLIKNWQIAVILILILSSIIGHFSGNKFTPEELKELKQIAQQIKTITSTP